MYKSICLYPRIKKAAILGGSLAVGALTVRLNV